MDENEYNEEGQKRRQQYLYVPALCISSPSRRSKYDLFETFVLQYVTLHDNMYRHACGDIIYFVNLSDVCKPLNACFLIMCIFTSSKHAGVNLLCRKCRFLNSCIFDPCLSSSYFFDQIWSDQLSNDGHLLKVFGWFMLSLSTAPGKVKY